MSDDWQNLTNGSFKGVPFHAAIPARDQQYGVESEEMTLERRLQFIKRPLVDGAPVRDWGADPETHVAVIEFFGVNHHKTAEAFLQVLNEGTPGILILPTMKKATLCYFWKRTRSTHYRDGNAIRVTVTWVDANEVASSGNGKASALSVAAPSIDQAKAGLDADVSNALGVLQDNPLLKAVRTFEAGVSKVRSTVNAVLTLEEGVRNKIASIDADIRGTLSQIKGAIDEIHSIFSPTAAAASSASAGSGSSLGTDSETGQTVIAVTEPDELPLPADPLAAPSLQPSVSVPTNNLGTKAGVAIFGESVASILASSRDDLASNSAGRTEDVSRALTAALNSLALYVDAVVGEAPLTYTVPLDMCLGEALFVNGVDLSELREVHKKNPQVTDTFLVPKGTVLVL
jgi:hypothetical protein